MPDHNQSGPFNCVRTTTHLRRYVLLILAASLLIDLFPAMPPSPLAYAADGLFSPFWLSDLSEESASAAWADYDRDGDLDLALGNQLYENHAGVLSTAPVWQFLGEDDTHKDDISSLAWGDYDGDGYLDMAIGIDGGNNRLYRNTAGGDSPFIDVSDTVWDQPAASPTSSLAWGDCSGDGIVDLVVGNDGAQNQIYITPRNPSEDNLAELKTFGTADKTNSVAWGDVDGMGTLVLAVGNANGDSLVYTNNGDCTLQSGPTFGDEATTSVAWSDYNNDGYLDLAVGEWNLRNTIYRYNHDTRTLTDEHTFTWSDETYGVAWGDYDGDGYADLAIANQNSANLVHRFNGSAWEENAWSSGESDSSRSIAWGDVDGDGDLDLAVGNHQTADRVYRNEYGVLATREPLFDSAPPGNMRSSAWGDYDNDGYQDLALGTQQKVLLFRHDAGTLVSGPLLDLHFFDNPSSLAWGDYDGDGDLDLAVGMDGRDNRLYRNNGDGTFDDVTATVWAVQPGGSKTTSLAWADYDGDEDLDLVVGNVDQPNHLYAYDNVNDTFTLVWTSQEEDATTSLAWGDVDGDNDLDLAVGNQGQPIRLYLNQHDQLSEQADWSSANAYETMSLAWGDVDGDGGLDLAVGNQHAANHIYRNEGGMLAERPFWSSVDTNDTMTIALADYDGDGDLDFTARNYEQATTIYRNDNGVLSNEATWSSGDALSERHLSWVDIDHDGDLDLITGSEDADEFGVYRNTRDARGSTAPIPTAHITRFDIADSVLPDAQGYSVPAILSEHTIDIEYTLSDPESNAVESIRAEFSTNGGGTWNAAVAAPGSDTGNAPDGETDIDLATSPNGETYTFKWDTVASGFFGQSDNVIFRIIAIPAISQSAVAGPYQRAAHATQTLPFRVRGIQVKVVPSEPDDEGKKDPVADCLVYRRAAGTTDQAQPLTNLNGEPFRTDEQGYLAGSGEIRSGDMLLVLCPDDEQSTSTHTTYSTNLKFDAVYELGYDAYIVPADTATLEIPVSEATPLILLNLDISLEWDARKDTAFLNRLTFDLQRTSAILYDWSNGQVALGHINVYQDLDFWEDAHIRIFATNRLRPNADQGGIVRDDILPYDGEYGTLTCTYQESEAKKGIVCKDPKDEDITYKTGQLRIGAVWNRYGEIEGNVGEDWPLTLAHELGHYALFLDDNYLGMDENGLLETIATCRGAMSDPYTEDESEFYPSEGWDDECSNTLSEHATGRSDWETMGTFYPALVTPTKSFDDLLEGPFTIPMAVTQIDLSDEPEHSQPLLDAPVFSLVKDGTGEPEILGSATRVFLFDSSGDYVTDLGNPVVDQVEARGAAVGDTLCVYALEEELVGCKEIKRNDNQQLVMKPRPDWRPDVMITPANSRSIDLTVDANHVGDVSELSATLYPENNPVSDDEDTKDINELCFDTYDDTDNDGNPEPTYTIDLTLEGDEFVGTFKLCEPALAGRVHIFDPNEPDVSEAASIVASYAIGGNPGHHFIRRSSRLNTSSRRRRSHGHRSSRGRRRSRRAPTVSPDGQVILFGEHLQFNDDEFFSLQPATITPDVPIWYNRVGYAYHLLTSDDAPQLDDGEEPVSISFSYMGGDLVAGEEEHLAIYYWNEEAGEVGEWEQLEHTQHYTHENMVSGQARGAGLYILLSTTPIELKQGWNEFGYPVRGSRPIAEALQSIAGKYTSVWHRDATAVPRDEEWAQWFGYHTAGSDANEQIPERVNDLEYLEFGKSYHIYVTEDTLLYLNGLPDSQMYTDDEDAPSVTARSRVGRSSAAHVPAAYYGSLSGLPEMGDTGEQTIEAWVNDERCGVGTIAEESGEVVYDITVVAAGCKAAPGDYITFKVNEQTMATMEQWSNVQAHGVDLVPAPAIQLPADRLEVEEGEEIIIPITLSGAFSHTVTVSHTLEDMTTTADADYVSLDTPGITFQTTQTHTITISTKDDDIPEQTEHMRLMLYDAVNASLQTTVVTITITDNDSDEESSLSPPPSRFRFESDTVLVDEGQTTVTITATMNITPTEPVTMTVRSRDSGGAGADKRSATAGVDYVLTDTSRTFSSDGMSQHFTLTITDDLEVEETEEVILELLDAANPALPAEARTTVIIEDNDTNTLPTLEFATDEQHEPFGTETITVAVRLSEPTSTTVTAECISGHSNIATTGTDTSYIATVEFAPETDTGYCTIPLASDNVRLNEAMPLFLREPVGAQLGSRDSTRLYIDYHPQLFYLPVVAKAQQ